MTTPRIAPSSAGGLTAAAIAELAAAAHIRKVMRNRMAVSGSVRGSLRALPEPRNAILFVLAAK
jgi:hypothetical protein